eukprot:2455855-Amphidinium_carterae.3
MRLGYPSVTTPNRHLQCGASSTIGGDIICVKCIRTHVWIREENWLVQTREELGLVWSAVHQRLIEIEIENAAAQPQLRVMYPGDQGNHQLHQCWYTGCAVLGDLLCEHRGCRRHAFPAHRFSIFLPDGALAAKWCSAHRRPAVSNKYMGMRKKVCCKCGSDSGIIGCMFEGCDHYWCSCHGLKRPRS